MSTLPQALGDGGQGWGNVVLFVLASDKIRTRLFGGLIYYCSTVDSAEPARNEPPPHRFRDRGNYGDPHIAVGPVAINVQKQSATYSVDTHEPTSPIN